jgi:hypothetical protein
VYDRDEDIRELWADEIDKLRRRFGLRSEPAVEEFVSNVRLNYDNGNYRTALYVSLNLLLDDYPTLIDIADFLRVKNASAVSHMIGRGRMEFRHILTVIDEYGHDIWFDNRNKCHYLGGYASATSYIRRTYLRQNRLGRKSPSKELSFEHCEHLFAVFCSEEWSNAHVSRVPEALKATSDSIATQVRSCDCVQKEHRVLQVRRNRLKKVIKFGLSRMTSQADTVRMIERIVQEWREAFLLCVWAMGEES